MSLLLKNENTTIDLSFINASNKSTIRVLHPEPKQYVSTTERTLTNDSEFSLGQISETKVSGTFSYSEYHAVREFQKLIDNQQEKFTLVRMKPDNEIVLGEWYVVEVVEDIEMVEGDFDLVTWDISLVSELPYSN